MIPKGWIATRLSKIADVTSGGTPSRAKAEYWCGHIPWVTTSEIHNGLITDTVEKITENGLVNSSAKLFPVGTILMAMYGQGATRGKVARLGIEASTNQACAAILPKPSVCGEYLFQNMLSRYEEIRNLANDGSQKNLSGGLIKKIPILQPPLAEQRRIAEILSTWDRAIKTTEKLIANSEAQRKALMQRLLTGKKRLPGYSGEWEAVRLGTRGAFRKGRGISKADVRSAGLPCIRYGEIYTHHHDVVRSFNSYIDEAVAAESERINPGDILFTCSGETAEEIGKAVAYLDDREAYAGGDIVIFAAQKDCPRFLGYLLNSKPLADQKARMGQGNSVVHISAANLGKLEFSLPDRAEQEDIAALLAALDDSLIILEAQAEALRREKSALMQQLLTGKRRVKLPEKVHA